MKIKRRWAFWRRLQYGVGFFSVLALLGGYVYYSHFYTPDSCFDMVMSGDETGVDCGGGCLRMCVAEVIPPKVIWTKSFQIVDGQYNAVAYVENSNMLAATPELKYTFQFFTGETLIGERSGTTVLPPNSVYPIFEGRIMTEGKVITDTKLIIHPTDLWLPASLGRDQFKTSNISLVGADLEPRLNVTIENIELTPAEKVEVVATLFNEIGEPLTASQTFVETLAARSTKDIVFTWPNSIAKTVRSCIVPTDVVMAIDLSGSMNNDGGTPPQPISDTLIAAKKFVENLNKNDRISLVTFATDAITNKQLSNDHKDAALAVGNLTINPVEETGYTNTSAALIMAKTELGSERHNTDARRVVVLLTDGMPTAKDDSFDVVGEAKAAAKSLSESGVEVYAIGLGKNVNLDFIRSIGSDDAHTYFAPTATDLDSIYSKITSSLCESGATRIDVIAKTPTNFPQFPPPR